MLAFGIGFILLTSFTLHARHGSLAPRFSSGGLSADAAADSAAGAAAAAAPPTTALVPRATLRPAGGAPTAVAPPTTLRATARRGIAGSGPEAAGFAGTEAAKECREAARRPMRARKPSDFVTPLHGAGAVQSGPLRCCAIVGSSPVLVGRGLGAEIDAFDTVVRVNRVPVSSFFRDFGQKTDIVFVNDRHWFRAAIPVLGGSAPRNCSLPGQCNFTVVLSSWQPCPERDWKNISQYWRSARCPVGHEVDRVGDGLRAYLPKQPGGKEHFMPSNGMHAFFSFATQCAYTRMYGFGGPQVSADGHNISSFHNFAAEHMVMRMIGAGQSQALAAIHKKAKKKWDVGPQWLPTHLEQLAGRIGFA